MIKITPWSWRLAAAGVMIGWLGVVRGAAATDVVSFQLVSAGGLAAAPSVMHGAQAFDRIQVAFNAEVFVDFYDLSVSAVGSRAYCLPMTDFSYDSGTRVAAWRVAGQPIEQNERFRAVLSGVWDRDGTRLTGGGYTNEFTILTGDVGRDDRVSSADLLAITHHINQSMPYDADLDVNMDGAVSAMDAMIVNSMLNRAGGVIPLIGVGAFHVVCRDPPARLEALEIVHDKGRVTLRFSGLPEGSMIGIDAKGTLRGDRWLRVVLTGVTAGVDRISFPADRGGFSEFYRASFQ